MCFNGCGLGALNMFWVICGSLLTLAQCGSFDCSLVIEGARNIKYTCSELEQWLNMQWAIGYIGWLFTAVILALLPKLVKDYPPSANTAVMRTVSGIFLLVTIGSTLMIGSTQNAVKLTPDTSIPAVTALTYEITAVTSAILVLSALVHKEPVADKGLL
jgi:hypothetical protein